MFPVALYLKGGSSTGSSEYRETLFGQDVVRFRYASVALPHLIAEEYLDKGALAASLAALMRRARGPEGLALRVRMIRAVLESDLDEARRSLLGYVIASYYPLGEDEFEEFKRMAEKEGSEDMSSMDVNWADQLRLDGREEGLLEGVARGKRETLKRQLAAKFGPLTEEVEARIDAVESSEELDGYLDRVLTAETLDAIGLEK